MLGDAGRCWEMLRRHQIALPERPRTPSLTLNSTTAAPGGTSENHGKITSHHKQLSQRHARKSKKSSDRADASNNSSPPLRAAQTWGSWAALQAVPQPCFGPFSVVFDMQGSRWRLITLSRALPHSHTCSCAASTTRHGATHRHAPACHPQHRPSHSCGQGRLICYSCPLSQRKAPYKNSIMLRY